MNGTATMAWAAAVLGASLLGAGLAFTLTRGFYRGRLRVAHERVEHMAKVRAQTTEMLLQARRQVDVLSKELEALRRLRAAARAAAAPPKPAPSPRDVPVVSATGFAETQLPPAHPGGFADTLPLAPDAVPGA